MYFFGIMFRKILNYALHENEKAVGEISSQQRWQFQPEQAKVKQHYFIRGNYHQSLRLTSYLLPKVCIFSIEADWIL